MYRCDSPLRAETISTLRGGPMLIDETAGTFSWELTFVGGTGRFPQRIGGDNEWHLDFDKTFRQIAFDRGAWSGQPAVVIVSSLLEPGFKAIRSVRNSMGGDGIEQVVVQA